MILPTSIYTDSRYNQLRREWLAADELFKLVARDMDGTNCDTYETAMSLRHEAAENLYNYTLAYQENSHGL